ncbi:hypothetical protein ACOM2C_05370 [Pseudarthrobacter sp. So.54]
MAITSPRDDHEIPELGALSRLGLGEEWLRAVLWENGARLLDLPAVHL